jgi:hypothetical protein
VWTVGRSVTSRLIVASLALVVGIVAIVVVSRPAPRTLTYADLKADPAFALRMADSDVLLETGSEAERGIDGSTEAFAGHVFGTSATSAEVYTFYERELARLGWRPERGPYSRSGVELENRDYCKSGATFRLAIKDKNRAFQPSLYKGKDYVTVFDAALLGTDPRQQCPLPPITPFPSISH